MPKANPIDLFSNDGASNRDPAVGVSAADAAPNVLVLLYFVAT